MAQDFKCGLAFCHPSWLQRFATSRMFIVIYGFLGTIQAMAYVYLVVTLTTMEKRFQIKSSTFGIILSGNEVSQILLSLILSYLGGYRNRPRWIAWGVFCCALSCFILALPHFLYGPGEEALRLTEEYASTEFLPINVTQDAMYKTKNRLCTLDTVSKECSDEYSIVPLALIFLSNFVLGIGNTLYYSLGQSYLDDNISNKTSTPLMLAWAFSLRMMGPAIGFLVGFGCLKVYIDPTKTPTISSKDPRWLGAWWLGWILMGVAQAFFSVLIGLFPKTLPKHRPSKESNMLQQPMTRPFAGSSGNILDLKDSSEDFFKAVRRLLKNKVLMFNIFSGVFYILGSSGFITYIAKYMEVQFHRNSSDATIITGPITLLGMVAGIIASGYYISKRKPHARFLLFWNVIVGCVYILGQFSNLFWTCPDGNMPLVAGRLTNLTTSCNSNCACDKVPYSPVCHDETGITYFSPCHAGCQKWDEVDRYYSECSCISAPLPFELPMVPREFKGIQPAKEVLSSEFKKLRTTEDDLVEVLQKNKTDFEILPPPAPEPSEDPPKVEDDYNYDDYEAETISRRRRDVSSPDSLLSGACLKGCAFGFYAFTITSAIINIFGSSGRIGNILVNYRCVKKDDKSVTQGLFLMLISLFALIPGPIIYGRIIDSTCLVWTEECGQKGTCQLYDQKSFRYLVNLSAMAFTSIGVIFDVLVWWYGRHLELYEENEGDNESPSKEPLNPSKR